MTSYVKDKKDEILKLFVDICNENNYWYSLDDLSLLSLFSNKQINEKIDHHSVMMTYESYESLRAKYPNHVLDNAKHSEYHSLQIKFLENSENIFLEQPFININLIIPTTVNKINNFINLKNKIRSIFAFYKTYKQTNILTLRHKIKMIKSFAKFVKPLLYKTLVNDIYDENYEGFIITSPIITKNILKKWIPHTSFKLIDAKLNEINVKLFFEYENYLIEIYGKKYFEYDLQSSTNNYLNPVEIWDLNLINQKANKDSAQKENTENLNSSEDLEIKENKE